MIDSLSTLFDGLKITDTEQEPNKKLFKAIDPSDQKYSSVTIFTSQINNFIKKDKEDKEEKDKKEKDKMDSKDKKEKKDRPKKIPEWYAIYGYIALLLDFNSEEIKSTPNNCSGGSSRIFYKFNKQKFYDALKEYCERKIKNYNENKSLKKLDKGINETVLKQSLNSFITDIVKDLPIELQFPVSTSIRELLGYSLPIDLDSDELKSIGPHTIACVTLADNRFKDENIILHDHDDDHDIRKSFNFFHFANCIDMYHDEISGDIRTESFLYLDPNECALSGGNVKIVNKVRQIIYEQSFGYYAESIGKSSQLGLQPSTSGKSSQLGLQPSNNDKSNLTDLQPSDNGKSNLTDLQPSDNGNSSSKSGRDYVIESVLYQVLKPKEDSKSHHILDKIIPNKDNQWLTNGPYVNDNKRTAIFEPMLGKFTGISISFDKLKNDIIQKITGKPTLEIIPSDSKFLKLRQLYYIANSNDHNIDPDYKIEARRILTTNYGINFEPPLPVSEVMTYPVMIIEDSRLSDDIHLEMKDDKNNSNAFKYLSSTELKNDIDGANPTTPSHVNITAQFKTFEKTSSEEYRAKGWMGINIDDIFGYKIFDRICLYDPVDSCIKCYSKNRTFMVKMRNPNVNAICHSITDILLKDDYNDNKEVYDEICYLLLLCKNAGDWLLALICLYFYIIPKSNDILMLLYAIYIGAPVFYNNQLYNYKPSEQFWKYGFKSNKLFKNVDKRGISIRPSNSVSDLFVNLGYFDDNRDYYAAESRYYKNKYLKYKYKYLKAKGVDNKILNLIKDKLNTNTSSNNLEKYINKYNKYKQKYINLIIS